MCEFPSLYFAKIENSAICDTAEWARRCKQRGGDSTLTPQRKGGACRNLIWQLNTNRGQMGGRREGVTEALGSPSQDPWRKGSFQGVNKS